MADSVTAENSARRHRRRSIAPSRRLTGIALALTSLLILWLALRMLLAALFTDQAQAFLDDWGRQETPPNDAAILVAEHAAQAAVSLYPTSSGAYLDRLGRVYSFAKDPRALDTYREAIAARPLWPHSHGRLAAEKLRQGERDQELIDAMHRAFELGPWRPLVNRRLTEVGWIAWADLDPETRRLVLENARRYSSVSRRSAEWVREHAKATRKTSLLVLVQ